MSYIFLDESGDLGFDQSKKRSTRYFIITFLFTSEKRSIEKVVRSIHAGLRKKYKMKSGTLHACKEEPETCARFCKKLSSRKCKIMVIYLNKNKVHTRLQDEKAVLYNYVTNILLDRIITKRLVDKNDQIELIASRRETNKFLNENFKNYLKNQVKNNHKVDIQIQIRAPHEEKSLQAADMASWAVFRKYELSDDGYYNLIKDLIIEESPLFP